MLWLLAPLRTAWLVLQNSSDMPQPGNLQKARRAATLGVPLSVTVLQICGLGHVWTVLQYDNHCDASVVAWVIWISSLENRMNQTSASCSRNTRIQLLIFFFWLYMCVPAGRTTYQTHPR